MSTNDQHTKPATLEVIETNYAALPPQRNAWVVAFARMRQNVLSVIGLVIITVFSLAAIFGPALAPYPYRQQHLTRIAETPSRDFWLGTDDLGRDLLSRILWGARTAAIVAAVSTSISFAVGVLLGALAAYIGGWVDWLVTRLIDVTMSIPSLLLASVLAATFRAPVFAWVDRMYEQTGWAIFEVPSYYTLVLVFGALAFIQWPGYARLIRGQILALRNQEFVVAAKSMGAREYRIVLRHLLPNALGPLIVHLTFSLGGAITAESALAVLGVGIQPPQASWGQMIADNALSWRYRPWLVLVPATVVASVSIAFAFLGDGLNDVLNPRRGH